MIRKLKKVRKGYLINQASLNLIYITYNLHLQSSSEEFQGVQEFLKINVIFDILFCYQFEMDEEDGIFTSVIIIMLIP